MNFEDYQEFVKAVSTTRVDGDIARINWAVQELVAEAGEVLGVSAKAWRKGMPIDKDRLWDELSDTLWGIAAVMNEAFPKRTLEQLMWYNREKLEARIAKQD